MQKFSVLLTAVAAALCLSLSAAAQPDPAAAPVRIAPAVMASNLLSIVDPVYPAEAKAAHLEGTVVLNARISTKGVIEVLNVESGDEVFREGAMKAVQLWRYKPVLTNGVPTEVDTTITIKYAFSDSGEPQVHTEHPENMPPIPKRIGGSVLPPRVIFQVEPTFSKKERSEWINASVLVNLWVDEQGNPQHIRILRGYNDTFNDKAVKAVEQYKFAPATLNGKPVLVELNIEVNFKSTPR
jgi:TonB family protein